MTLEVHALVQYAQDFHVTLSATPEEDHVPGVRIAPQPVPDIRPCPACDFASPQSFEDRGQATKIAVTLRHPPRLLGKATDLLDVFPSKRRKRQIRH